jgi:glycerate kinase
MPLRILIVPDKFKGTMTAPEAARAIAAGWASVRPGDALELLPMADGGDGFGEVFGRLLGAGRRTCRTVDAAGRPRAAGWWHDQDGSTAVVEAAQTNGLALLPPGGFHPFQLDTFGLGAVLRAARDAGVRRCLVGIGGSATNDGGFGLARSLGWHFVDGRGEDIRAWTGLQGLERIIEPPDRLPFEELIVAVDVANPLLGPDGASRVYGPQKGLRGEDIGKAEACLARLAAVARALSGGDFAELPGAGAAGGLGFGLMLFCGGRFQPGGELFIELSRLEERVQQADLVITGEGAFDAQSLMGKGVGRIAALADRLGRPCLCLAGAVGNPGGRFPWQDFRVEGIVPGIAGLVAAMAQPGDCLRRLAAKMAETWCV